MFDRVERMAESEQLYDCLVSVTAVLYSAILCTCLKAFLCPPSHSCICMHMAAPHSGTT